MKGNLSSPSNGPAVPESVLGLLQKDSRKRELNEKVLLGLALLFSFTGLFGYVHSLLMSNPDSQSIAVRILPAAVFLIHSWIRYGASTTGMIGVRYAAERSDFNAFNGALTRVVSSGVANGVLERCIQAISNTGGTHDGQ